MNGAVMTSYRFFNMASVESEIHTGYDFCDDIRLRREKSISVANFDEISQFTAEIKLLLFYKNGTTAIVEIYFRFRYLNS